MNKKASGEALRVTKKVMRTRITCKIDLFKVIIGLKIFSTSQNKEKHNRSSDHSETIKRYVCIWQLASEV